MVCKAKYGSCKDTHTKGLKGPGTGRHMSSNFSKGPSRVGTWGVIILKSRAGPSKREKNFFTTGPGYKKRKTNNIASQSEPTK